jgi:hypothetical protein
VIIVYSLSEARTMCADSWNTDILGRHWSEDGHGYLVGKTRKFCLGNQSDNLDPFELREPFQSETFARWEEDCTDTPEPG